MPTFISDAELIDDSQSGFVSDADIINAAPVEQPLAVKAASGFLKGTTGLADLAEIVSRVPEAILTPGKDIFRPLSAGNTLGSLFKSATGREDALDIGKGDFTHTAASYLPGAVLGPANIWKNAIQTGAQAVGAGLGQEVAGDAGELVGGLAPSALTSMFRKGIELLGPQTENAAQVVIGNMAKRFGISESDIVKALKAQKNDSLGAIKSSAEVLKSPQLATLEDQVATGGGLALDYGKKTAERIGEGGSYQKVLDAVSENRNSVKEIGGKTILDAFDQAKKESGDKVSALYDAISKDTKAPIMNLKGSITKATKELLGPGSTQKVPDQLQRIISYIQDPANKSRLTIQELQNLRRDVGAFIKESTKPGTPIEKFAVSIKSALKNTIEKAPSGAKDWIKANTAYAEHAAMFKNGTLGKFFKDRDRIASQVADQIIKSPESAAQFDSIFQGNRPVMQVVKDDIATHLGGLIQNGKLDAAKKFITDNQSELKSLLREDFSYLSDISNAIASSATVKRMANAAGGPQTAKRLSNIVQAAITGKNTAINPGKFNMAIQALGIGSGAALHANPLAALAAIVTGVGVGALRGRSNEVVGKALFRGLMEPRYLKDSIAAATKDASKFSKGLFSIGAQSAVPIINVGE